MRPGGAPHGTLRCDAAASYAELTPPTSAFAAAVHHRPPTAPREQIAAFYREAGAGRGPGTSNHGWALAVDLCGGIKIAGSAQWTWMTANAGGFQLTWAGPAGEKPEPWHWEYGYIS